MTVPKLNEYKYYEIEGLVVGDLSIRAYKTDKPYTMVFHEVYNPFWCDILNDRLYINNHFETVFIFDPKTMDLRMQDKRK